MHIKHLLSAQAEEIPVFDSSTDVLMRALQRAARGQGNVDVAMLVEQAASTPQYLAAGFIADLLYEACRSAQPLALKKAFTRLPGFEANAAGTHGRVPLTSAVEAGDLAFARHLLRVGAEPALHTGPLPRDDDHAEAAALLQAAKVINALIPTSAMAEFSSPLGAAMRDYDIAAVRCLLEEERARQTDPGDRTLWIMAVQGRRLDVLCAMLAVGTPAAIHALAGDSVPRQSDVLHEAMKLGHPALQTYLKQIPYYSSKRPAPVNNNMRAALHGRDDKIACRHLASYWLLQRARPDAMNYEALGSIRRIEESVPPNMDKIYESMRTQAAETHLIDNRQFGQFLRERFVTMQQVTAPAGPGVLRRRMLLLSSIHAMAMELKLATGRDGRWHCAVAVYDPNWTNVHKRASTTNPGVVTRWRLESFFGRAGCPARYYPEEEKMSLVHILSDTSASIETSKMLASTLPPLSSTVLHHLLEAGLSGELQRRKADILAHLRGLGEEEATRFLLAEDYRRIPGLQMAIQRGHAEAVAAYGDILAEAGLSDASMTALLHARDTDGMCALQIGLLYMRNEAVAAYGDLLRKYVSRSERARFLVMEHAGMPWLYQAMGGGRANVISVYGEVLARAELGRDDMFSLLAARSDSGTPTIVAACRRGHVDAARAYGELLQRLRLPVADRVVLLAHERDGIPWLFETLRDDSAGALAAYGAAIQASGVPANQRLALLTVSAPAFGDIPWLSAACKHGRSEAIDAYGQILLQSDLAPEELARALSVMEREGTPALHAALEVGSAAAIKAFIALVGRCNVGTEQSIALLEARDAHGTPGLFKAFSNNHKDAILAFGETLAALPVPSDAKARLMAAQGRNGTSGIFVLYQPGHAEALRAWREAMRLVNRT